MKNKKLPVTEDKPQTGKPTKKKDNNTPNKAHDPAVANKYTDTVKNTAGKQVGLNQASTTKNDPDPGFE